MGGRSSSVLLRSVVEVSEHVRAAARLEVRLGFGVRLLVDLCTLGAVRSAGHITQAFLFQLVEPQKVLLSVAPYLAAGARSDMLFDQAPVLTVHIKAFEESTVLSVGPAAAHPSTSPVGLGDHAVLSAGAGKIRTWLSRGRLSILALESRRYHAQNSLLSTARLHKGRLLVDGALEVRNFSGIAHERPPDCGVKLFTCLEVSLSISIRCHEVVVISGLI